MTVDATANSALTKLASSYKSTDTEKDNEEDYLGREAFLTMLVAQLKNQDPLNPMEGSDFSAQLAQFSSLEQLMNLNESMQSMADAFQSSSQTDASSFLGKKVTGTANSIEVSSGTASEGYYNLSDKSEVMIYISNEDGDVVRTLYPGEQDAGSYNISWDGTDNSGEAVEDGSYTYQVFTNTGSGFTELSTAVTGTVDGITYQNGKAYLDINGVLLNVDSITKVAEPDSTSDSTMTALDYLGQNVSYSSSVMAVQDGSVSGGGIKFNLDNQEDVVIKIMDSNGNIVNSTSIPAESTVAGENTIQWDGTNTTGDAVSDGLYTYSIETDSGSAAVSGSGDVTGIKYINGSQYLVVGDDSDLVSVSSVTGIN